jgi:hypothetical protein
MRSLYAVGALLVAVMRSSVVVAHAPDHSCYVVAIALLIDEVKDVRDIKYHRVVVTGIRKLDAVGDSTDMSCQPRDAVVPMIMRQEADNRFRGTMLKAPQVARSFLVQHPSLAVVENEIKRFAIVARQHPGTFTRVETVSVDAPEAPRTAELPLPALATSPAEANACAADNRALEQSKAKYRWAC